MKRFLSITSLGVLGLLGLFAALPNQNVSAANDQGAISLEDVVAEIPSYETKAGVSGSVSSVGSDTLNNLMDLWKESFRKRYPNVDISVIGQGSSTAPPALIDGTSDLGPMSRAMKDKEVDDFEKKFGYKPTAIKVAIDALAVFAHKDNPVESLTLPQVDAMFSSTRKGGYDKDITKWGQTGLKGDWANLGITLYGRNSASGTYGYFKKKALFKGDYKNSVKEQPGSAAVVQSISEDRSAIGYSGMGYATAGVRIIPLAKDAGSTAYEATPDNCYGGKYPLSRFLYIYVNKAPGEDLKPVVKEFLKFILSRNGQEVVIKDGFIPLTKKITSSQQEILQ